MLFPSLGDMPKSKKGASIPCRGALAQCRLAAPAFRVSWEQAECGRRAEALPPTTEAARFAASAASMHEGLGSFALMRTPNKITCLLVGNFSSPPLPGVLKVSRVGRRPEAKRKPPSTRLSPPRVNWLPLSRSVGSSSFLPAQLPCPEAALPGSSAGDPTRSTIFRNSASMAIHYPLLTDGEVEPVGHSSRSRPSFPGHLFCSNTATPQCEFAPKLVNDLYSLDFLALGWKHQLRPTWQHSVH
ncbi:hypothetical protein GGE46_005404 [Rhizobium etli]|uniref:Uncharacterized protein n=1 Tax=Rhizobium etli TaxID=29449 RepID=A0A7W6VEE6_RHIET|nr:hypothetical protein [Rhizobium etli]MBB4538617.1 hypothetical protein [Rhizobium etli]